MVEKKIIKGRRLRVYEQEIPLDADIDMDDFLQSLADEDKYEKEFQKLKSECKELLKDAEESRPSVYWEVGDILNKFLKTFPEKDARKFRAKYNVKTNFLKRLGKELKFKLRTIRAITEFRKLYSNVNKLDESISYYVYHELIPLKNDKPALNYLDNLLREKKITERHVVRKIVKKYKEQKTKDKGANLILLQKIIEDYNT